MSRVRPSDLNIESKLSVTYDSIQSNVYIQQLLNTHTSVNRLSLCVIIAI